VLILFARFAYLRIALHPTPRSDYWQAQIDALDPPGPGAFKHSDAAPILASRQWEALAATPSGGIYEPYDLLRGTWDPKRPDIVSLGAAFKSAVFVQERADLLKITRTDWVRNSDFLSSSSNPGWTAARQWAKGLMGHSRWARMFHGDMSETVEDWQAALRLARQSSRSHLAIDELVRISIERMIGQEMLLTAGEPHGPIDVRVLADLTEGLRPSPFEPAAFLEGERLAIHDRLERMYIREGGDWLDVSNCADFYKEGSGMSPGPVLRIWNLASPLFNDLGQARQHTDNSFEYLKTISNLAICDDLEYRRIAVPRSCEVGILDGLMYPYPYSAARAIRLMYEGRTALEAGLTALALSEFQRRHGEYPKGVESLVPDYLQHLPVDYGDRGVLRYRRLPDGAYLLYSIGVDGKDDGGRFNPTLEDYPDRFDRSNPDAVFSAVRRKKAPQFHMAESGGGI